MTHDLRSHVRRRTNAALLKLDLRATGLQRRMCELLIEAAEKNRTIVDINVEYNGGESFAVYVLIVWTVTAALLTLAPPAISTVLRPLPALRAAGAEPRWSGASDDATRCSAGAPRSVPAQRGPQHGFVNRCSRVGLVSAEWLLF